MEPEGGQAEDEEAEGGQAQQLGVEGGQLVEEEAEGGQAQQLQGEGGQAVEDQAEGEGDRAEQQEGEWVQLDLRSHLEPSRRGATLLQAEVEGAVEDQAGVDEAVGVQLSP